MFAIGPTGHQTLTVGAASAKFTAAMAPGAVYRFTANTDCWVTTGLTGGAAVAGAAENTLVLSGQTILLTGSPLTATGNFVHAIRNTANGTATLSKLQGMGG